MTLNIQKVQFQCLINFLSKNFASEKGSVTTFPFYIKRSTEIATILSTGIILDEGLDGGGGGGLVFFIH